MTGDAQEETLSFLGSLDGEATIASTHISRVVLGKTRAFKLKRPVSFPYLDFSTPQRRLAMCAREVALNRRTAPKLYLGARRVTRERNGALALDGEGTLVDAVVEMRRFADDAVLDRMAEQGRLEPQIIEALARRIARFHDAAEPVPYGGLAAMRRVIALDDASLRQAPPASAQEIAAHCAALAALVEKHGARLDARHAAGKTRRCHGDLILRNVCMLDGEPTPFDCIEFSDELAAIDVLYDLAFLLMDLCRVGRRDLANLALNRYLDARDETDGLPLLPLFMSLRATIRAHVAAAKGDTAEAAAEFALAQRLAREGAPCLVAIGGLSGAGKSSVAAALAPRIGAAPGARTLGSDRLRKKLCGAEPLDRLPPEAYAPAVSERVYAALAAGAAETCAAPWAVIADAVFDRPERRSEIEKIARDAGVPFFGVWLEARFEARLDRVEARRDDPSDATREVLLRQMQYDSGAILWRRVDAGRSLDEIVAEIAGFVGA